MGFHNVLFLHSGGGGDIFLEFSGVFTPFFELQCKNIWWDLEAFGLKVFFEYILF